MQTNTRLPAVPFEEFVFAMQLMNGVIDGSVKTKNPEEYAMLMPDGSHIPMDDSFSARIYMALKEALNHLDRSQIHSITQRYKILDLTTDNTQFDGHFNDDRSCATDEFIESIINFPLWTNDSEKVSVERLEKFITRKKY